MAFPYLDLVPLLILAYVVYLGVTRKDGRYPIGLALVLLVIAAIVDAAGDPSGANTLATFVFYLLAGGVLLLLVEHVREARSGPDRSPGSEPRAPETYGATDPARSDPGPQNGSTPAPSDIEEPTDGPALGSGTV